MFKPMFDNDGRYIDIAFEIDKYIEPYIVNVFKKYVDLGYSFRDIATILHSKVQEEMCMQALDYSDPERKGK